MTSVIYITVALTTLITWSGVVNCQRERPDQSTRVPFCQGCYKGLCTSANYTRYPGAIVDTLFPGLFKTQQEAGYGDCKRVAGGDKAIQWQCPSGTKQNAGGCEDPSHFADLDECCVTCRSNYIENVIESSTHGGDAYVIHLPWRNMYQTFPVGYCGEQRHCTGECREVLVQHKVLVANTTISYESDLEGADYWFETLELPAYCYCGGTNNAVAIATTTKAIWPFATLVALFRGL